MISNDNTPKKTDEIGQRDDKGRFAEGNPGKPKGARHKLTGAIKNILMDVFETDFTAEKIRSYIQSLDDADKLRFMVNLLPYIAPKAPPAPPEPEAPEESPFDPSKLSDDELRYLAQLQEKARRDRTPPIRWGDDDPDPKNEKPNEFNNL
jgi:hypothetical protein